MTTTTLFPANERGQGDYGWLKTNYSFSFASWYNPHKMVFGSLRVLNDDQIAPGQGFGTHSHQNMEIITIVLKGELEHKDSMGNIGRVGAGEIQIMSAGTGVDHSEYNPSDSESLELFQLWIYPEKIGIAPRYGQKMIDREVKNQWQQIIGPLDGEENVLQINQQGYISILQTDEKKEIEYNLHNSANCAYFMVIEGNVEINGKNLGRRDAIGFSELDGENILLKTDQNTRILALEVPQ
ncbi:MAG: pirin family protein [candidate division SR1 bacterium]|nr:pirin family protein [candidate division SR1 bacterium]